MNLPLIPEDLRRFILTSVESVPYLEAVLLLRGEPRTPWDIKLVARRLYISDRKSADILLALHGAGLIAHTADDPAQWCYRPVSSELRDMVNRLAALYASNLVEVTHLIHSRHDRRAQQFAEAFRWRKD
jgi:hypothetical protein